VVDASGRVARYLREGQQYTLNLAVPSTAEYGASAQPFVDGDEVAAVTFDETQVSWAVEHTSAVQSDGAGAYVQVTSNHFSYFGFFAPSPGTCDVTINVLRDGINTADPRFLRAKLRGKGFYANAFYAGDGTVVFKNVRRNRKAVLEFWDPSHPNNRRAKIVNADVGEVSGNGKLVKYEACPSTGTPPPATVWLEDPAWAVRDLKVTVNGVCRYPYAGGPEVLAGASVAVFSKTSGKVAWRETDASGMATFFDLSAQNVRYVVNASADLFHKARETFVMRRNGGTYELSLDIPGAWPFCVIPTGGSGYGGS
jgi:hypothetical protein